MAPENIQKKFIGLCFEKFEVKDGVIITSRYSPLFQQLLDLNIVFTKSPKNKNPFDNKVYSDIIISPILGAYRDSNSN